MKGKKTLSPNERISRRNYLLMIFEGAVFWIAASFIDGNNVVSVFINEATGSLQLAGLFGTTLAPISGHFGWPFGILAGFIHSALVLQTGGPVAGLNLYNNGFSGGIIAIVLYPTITAIVRHRRPKLRDEDYYDLFEESAPIDVSTWRTHAKDHIPRHADSSESIYPQMPEDEDHEPVSDVTPTNYPQMPEDADCDSFGVHSHVTDEHGCHKES